jgi:membrane protein implicated in regulation of membrane protease activity
MDGAWWSVRSSTGDLEPGMLVRIVGIDGLELIVEPIGGDDDH